MSDRDLHHAVEQLLYREAYYLDLRQWDAWLDLYLEDAEFWMPAWISETELADDPRAQLSLMYMRDRGGLDDRVFRIRTDDSYASTPMPRSCHVVGNVLILNDDGETVTVSASWTVHQYASMKGARVHGGRYEYKLRRADDTWKIAAKKVIFLNDKVDVPLDVYNI